jgi:type IV pilus assembly protein PilV
MMSRPLMSRQMRRQGGVALLEALLAAVLLAIGLLGTIGLQARAYSALSDAGMRAEATIAAERLIGVMTTDPDSLSDYTLATGGTPSARLAPWYAATRKSIPGAQVAVTVVPGTGGGAANVTIAISWQRKADAPSNTHTVRAYI